jgi:hypothetical protein
MDRDETDNRKDTYLARILAEDLMRNFFLAVGKWSKEK